MRSHFAKLEVSDYCSLKIRNVDDFLALGMELGMPVASRKNSNELIDTLTVSTTRTDRSLSSKFKDQAFPFHSDGASLSIPPRYILLRSETENIGCPTILCALNITALEREILKRNIWFVNGGRGKFYASILSDRHQTDLIRYDLECMRTVLSENPSLQVMQEIIKKSKKIEVEWEKDLTLIIDNWKLLHARGNAAIHQNRVLQRIWINTENYGMEL